MLKAAWKSVLGHKARLLLSTIAIILGIAFLSGVLAFNHMINATIDDIVAGTTADVNVAPQGYYDSTQSSAGGSTFQQKELPAATLDKIRAVDGVESVSGLLNMEGVYPLNKSGKVSGNTFAPALATNMPVGDAYGGHPGIVVSEGRKPTKEGEVALDPATMQRDGYQVGDTVKIAFSGAVGTIQATIVGVANWGSGGSAGATYAFFDDQTLQKYAEDGKDVYMGAWVVAKPGQDLTALTQRVAEVGLPAGFEATDGKTASDAQSKSFKDSMSFMTNFLLVFAAIGLIVSIFLIVNTFTILVAQRSRELALYRAMGASRGQVTRSVLFEAIVVGVIGSLVGTVAGLGLALALSAWLRSSGSDLGSSRAVLDPSSFVICVLVGTVTTLLAALMPARRAGRVPPVAAMSGEAMTGQQGLGKRAVVGVILALAGLAVLLCGLWLAVPQKLWWVGLGALLTLLGVTLASPILGWPLMWLFGKLDGLLFGAVGRMAAMNASRSPRRTAATASALMIGVTLVSAFAILGNTAETSLHKDLVGGIKSQLIVETVSDSGWSDAVTTKLKSTAGVQSVVTYARASVLLPNQQSLVIFATSSNAFNTGFQQTLDEGKVATQPGEIMATKSYADRQGWHVGQTFDVQATSTTLHLTLVGIYENGKGVSMGQVQSPQSTFDGVKPAVLPSIGFVMLQAGANADQVAQTMNDELTDQPMIQVQTVAAFSKAMTSQVDQILAILYGLLGVAVIIAVFGIVNTLVLSILERRREVGLLRAVGLRRGQLRLMVGLESVIIAVLGAALGIGMGLLFGWALATTAVNRASFSIPWGQLGLFLVLSVIVGILAAIVPAIAASRMHTLRAIASE